MIVADYLRKAFSRVPHAPADVAGWLWIGFVFWSSSAFAQVYLDDNVPGSLMTGAWIGATALIMAACLGTTANFRAQRSWRGPWLWLTVAVVGPIWIAGLTQLSPYYWDNQTWFTSGLLVSLIFGCFALLGRYSGIAFFGLILAFLAISDMPDNTTVWAEVGRLGATLFRPDPSAGSILGPFETVIPMAILGSLVDCVVQRRGTANGQTPRLLERYRFAWCFAAFAVSLQFTVMHEIDFLVENLSEHRITCVPTAEGMAYFRILAGVSIAALVVARILTALRNGPMRAGISVLSLTAILPLLPGAAFPGLLLWVEQLLHRRRVSLPVEAVGLLRGIGWIAAFAALGAGLTLIQRLRVTEGGLGWPIARAIQDLPPQIVSNVFRGEWLDQLFAGWLAVALSLGTITLYRRFAGHWRSAYVPPIVLALTALCFSIILDPGVILLHRGVFPALVAVTLVAVIVFAVLFGTSAQARRARRTMSLWPRRLVFPVSAIAIIWAASDIAYYMFELRDLCSLFGCEGRWFDIRPFFLSF